MKRIATALAAALLAAACVAAPASLADDGWGWGGERGWGWDVPATTGLPDPDLPIIASATLGWHLDARDADSFTLSGDDVTEWRDKSGNNYHMGLGEAPSRDGDINGGIAVSFNGTSEYLSRATVVAMYSDPVFTFGVATGRGRIEFGRGGTNNATYHHIVGTEAGGARTIHGINSGGGDGGRSADTGTDTPELLNIGTTEYRSETDRRARRLGGNEAQNTVDSSSVNNATGAGLWELNAQWGDAGGAARDFHLGSIGEILIYTGSMSDADRDAVEEYLAARWGMDLVAWHGLDDDGGRRFAFWMRPRIWGSLPIMGDPRGI